MSQTIAIAFFAATMAAALCAFIWVTREPEPSPRMPDLRVYLVPVGGGSSPRYGSVARWAVKHNGASAT